MKRGSKRPAGGLGGEDGGEGAVDLKDPNSSVTMTMDSSSPDEKALTHFAQFMGYELFARVGGRIRLRVREEGKPARFEDFENVCFIDFSAKRKRMTVVVRPLDKDGHPVKDGPLKIFCKGADSFVRKLLRGCTQLPDGAQFDEKSDPQPNWPSTSNKLVDFGGESLRCLVIGECVRACVA